MAQNDRNLKKKYIKMLTNKFATDKEDKVIKHLIEELAVTMVECEQMKKEINEQGITVRDRYGCSVPNKLIPLYQKHKNIVDNKVKDLYKLTMIETTDEGILDISKYL